MNLNMNTSKHENRNVNKKHDMNKKHFWNSRIAFITVLSLLLSLVPTAAFAADPTPLAATDKAHISIDFLGYAQNDGSYGPAASKVENRMAMTNEDIGKVFWLGVRLSDLNKADFITKGGIRDLEIAFDYNPNLVRPCSNLSAAEEGSFSDAAWKTNLQTFNFTAADPADNKADAAQLWDHNLYALSTDDTVADVEPDTEDGREFLAEDGWKEMFISIQRTDADTASSNRFYGVADAVPYYILKIPMRLAGVPNAGEKPLAVRLALGPGSFVMTSGEAAESGIGYAWEKEDRSEAVLNLKNIFEFDGDINLFQDEGESELTALTVSHTVSGSAVANNNTLYTDAGLLTEAAFRTTTYHYYTTVAAFAETMTLNMTGPLTSPSVTHESGSVPTGSAIDTTPCAVTAAGTGQWSSTFPLESKGKDADGFTDIVKISVEQKDGTFAEYVLHIKREEEIAGEPKIILNYGNSPYGEIMKDDVVWRTLDKYKDELGDSDNDGIPDGREMWQEDAKTAFNLRNRYVVEYTPEDVKDIVKSYPNGYNPKAWVDSTGDQSLIEDPSVNIDRDDKAIFIYNNNSFADSFIDPGFTAVDSSGKEVATLDRRITVSRVATTDFKAMKNENQQPLQPIEILGKESQYLITEITPTFVNNDPTTRIVRPDVYDMEYSFYDTKTSTTVSAIRKVVVLNFTGDTDLNGIINLQDRNFMSIMNSNNQRPPAWLTDGKINVKESARLLYMYRIADTDGNGIVNPQDRNALSQANSGNKKTLPLFYRMLPSKID